MISFIWAEDVNGLIGNKNKLPWNIKEEMEHFKKTTWNKTIIMGSKTFDSLNKKPLKNRANIVLTKNVSKYDDIRYDNLFITNDSKTLINTFKMPDNDCFVIGGSEIFEIFIPYANKLIRTIIKKEYIGDVYMPKIKYNKYILDYEEEYDEFKIQYYIKKENTNEK